MPAVSDLLEIIDGLAPWDLAAEWDNCGLQVGSPGARIRRVALALDPTPDAIEAAAEKGAQVLVTHHPLLFRPLKSLNLEEPISQAAALAVRLDLAVIAAHTNLDAAENGVTRALADRLGIRNLQVLEPQPPRAAYKVTVYVPVGYEDRVRRALFAAQDNESGFYFNLRGGGVNVWQPDDSPERVDHTAMSRVEVTVDGRRLSRAMQAITTSHPLRPPIIDVHPLSPQGVVRGFGGLGYLENPFNIEELIELIKVKLEIPTVRLTAPPNGRVQKIALMPGSGGGYVGLARRKGADVLITGDVNYHQAREAEQVGLTVIDAGHWATERPVLGYFAKRLKAAAEENSMDIDFEVLDLEDDPWLNMEGRNIEP